MEAFQNIVNSVCKPLVVYDIFVLALISYNVTQSDFRSAGKNVIFLLIGSVLIWLLCFLGFGPAAWILLSMPIFFVLALLALLVITQVIKTDVKYDANGNKILITGKSLMNMFGLNDRDTLDKEMGLIKDYTDDVNGPYTPYVDPECLAKAAPPPPPPKITTKERVAGSLLATIPDCNICNTCITCN